IALADQRLRLTGDFLDVATRAHEALINMMDHLAAAQALRRDPALLEALAAFLDSGPNDDGPGGMDIEEIDFASFEAGNDGGDELVIDMPDAPGAPEMEIEEVTPALLNDEPLAAAEIEEVAEAVEV